MPLANGERVTLKVIDGADHFFRDLYVEEMADGAVGFIGPLTYCANIRSARNS